jgi:hypothetical protein
MSTKFIEPYLLLCNNNAYIRDVYTYANIKLTYSDNLNDLDCQLLFYGLKISRKCSRNINIPYGGAAYHLEFM